MEVVLLTTLCLLVNLQVNKPAGQLVGEQALCGTHDDRSAVRDQAHAGAKKSWLNTKRKLTHVQQCQSGEHHVLDSKAK